MKESKEEGIAELLKPRFKIIADYPGNTRPIGSVTTEIMTASYFRKYPANFKELSWWEERREDKMPEYLKTDTGKFIKIHHWDETLTLGWCEDLCRDFYADTCTPISESEYNNQK